MGRLSKASASPTPRTAVERSPKFRSSCHQLARVGERQLGTQKKTVATHGLPLLAPRSRRTSARACSHTCAGATAATNHDDGAPTTRLHGRRRRCHASTERKRVPAPSFAGCAKIGPAVVTESNQKSRARIRRILARSFVALRFAFDGQSHPDFQILHKISLPTVEPILLPFSSTFLQLAGTA